LTAAELSRESKGVGADKKQTKKRSAENTRRYPALQETKDAFLHICFSINNAKNTHLLPLFCLANKAAGTRQLALVYFGQLPFSL
jgi:hypothetical protein